MQRQIGLTLIEVLISLAIIAIAMTAVIKATSQTMRSTAYIQNKQIAAWVGQQFINEIIIGLRQLPDNSQVLSETVSVLDHDWSVTASLQNTPNDRIKQIVVSVYERESDSESDPALIRLESYKYASK
jgi:general secretion pathway protein I